MLLLGGAVLSSGGLDDILDQDQNQDRLDAIGALYGESAVIMTRR